MTLRPIVTLDQWVLEELHAQAETTLARVGGAVRSLLVYDQRRRPQVEGTGILVAIGEARFLLTAAHVLDSQKQLYLAGTDRMYTLSGPNARTLRPLGRPRSEDPFDLAWVQLSPAYVQVLGNVAWIQPDDVYAEPGRDALSEEPVRYLLVGFPSTKLKWRAPARVVDPQPVVYEAHGRPDSDYQRFGRSPAFHLVLDYAKKHSWSTAGQRTLPKPVGVSGGALFRMPPIRPLVGGSLGSSQLAAVVTDWPVEDRSVLLATRLCVALNGFRSHFPNLAHAWP